jgi:hypothetical protein
MASRAYDPQPASLAHGVRNLLAHYLSGDLKPREFEEKFASAMSAAFQVDDSETQALCRAVEWEFLDRDRGLSTDALLLKHLGELAEEPSQSILLGTPMILGDVPYCALSTSGTSSRLQPVTVVPVLLGQPRVLREMVSA